MDKLFLEAVKIVNPIQLVLIALIGFYFYGRLDDKDEGTTPRVQIRNEGTAQ